MKERVKVPMFELESVGYLNLETGKMGRIEASGVCRAIQRLTTSLSISEYEAQDIVEKLGEPLGLSLEEFLEAWVDE